MSTSATHTVAVHFTSAQLIAATLVVGGRRQQCADYVRGRNISRERAEQDGDQDRVAYWRRSAEYWQTQHDQADAILALLNEALTEASC